MNLEALESFDVRFENPSTFILAGASQCGKTTFVLNLLRNTQSLFRQPSCAQNIIYYYNQWQDALQRFQGENIVKDWIGKLPTTDDVTEKTLLFRDSGSIIVIDDFAQQLNKDTIDLFSRISHHTNSVIILMTQNLFSKNPAFRDISLNGTYILLFKNPRDSSQISCFAKQVAPGNTKYVIEAYREATKRPYSYLLFDNHQTTPEILRIRSNILPHEFPIQTYFPKNQNRTI